MPFPLRFFARIDACSTGDLQRQVPRFCFPDYGKVSLPFGGNASVVGDGKDVNLYYLMVFLVYKLLVSSL